MINWMIYGANGYTGELIAREAAARGMSPVLAGRNADKIESLAQHLKLKAAVFDLAEVEEIRKQIRGLKMVLHCAGPFSKTSKPMMEACLKEGVYYLDITGEIAVFEYAQSLNLQAKEANIVLCPGVGFDVIPTDCIAATLKGALPDAISLSLGFDSRSALSPGTAKTAVEGLAAGAKIRKNGALKAVPLAYKTRRIDFGDGEKLAMTISWGDISTAYYSTGIPNIEVFIPSSEKAISKIKKLNYLRWLLGLGFIQKLLKKKAGEQKGPSLTERENKTYVWGEATTAEGKVKTARIETVNGYALTVLGSLAVVEHLLSNPVEGGYTTPSQLMGKDFVSRLPGSSSMTIS